MLIYKELQYYYKINICKNSINNLNDYKCYRIDKTKPNTISNKIELRTIINELEALDKKKNITPFINKLQFIFLLLIGFKVYNTFY